MRIDCRSQRPEKSAYAHVVGVTFPGDVARDPRCREEIDTRPSMLPPGRGA
jgi:hypothetical protein